MTTAAASAVSTRAPSCSPTRRPWRRSPPRAGHGHPARVALRPRSTPAAGAARHVGRPLRVLMPARLCCRSPTSTTSPTRSCGPAQRRGARPRLHHRRRARAAGRLRAPLSPGQGGNWMPIYLPLWLLRAGVSGVERLARLAGRRGRSAGIRWIARCAARRSPPAPQRSSAGRRAFHSTRRSAAAFAAARRSEPPATPASTPA
jgi:hypothetical protein